MKKFLSLTLALAMALSLVACGGSGSSSTPAASSGASSSASSSAPAEPELKYPEQNINVVVQYSAGGGTDLSVRGVLDGVKDVPVNFSVANVLPSDAMPLPEQKPSKEPALPYPTGPNSLRRT